MIRTHGITHYDPEDCPGCKFLTVQIRPASPFQPHFNHSVGRYVNTKRQFEDALSRAADENSEITGTGHNYQPRYPGDTEPIREADQVLDDRARNLRAAQ